MTKMSDEALDRMASAYSSAPLGKHAPRDAMQQEVDPVRGLVEALEPFAKAFRDAGGDLTKDEREAAQRHSVQYDDFRRAATALSHLRDFMKEWGADSGAEGGVRGRLQAPPSPWHDMDETPRPGTKIVALYNDGSGAALLFVHDDGAISSEGDDCTFTPKSYERWAYLPTGFDFWCEGLAEDAVTLPDQPGDLFSTPPHTPASAPPEGWRCFHCDFVTSDKDEARKHFGPTLSWQAWCQERSPDLEKMRDEVTRADEVSHLLFRQKSKLEAALIRLGHKDEVDAAYAAAAAPPPPAPEVVPLTLPDDVRERIARVIDAGAFVEDETAVWLRSERQQALSKADQIIAIITGGE